MSPQDFTQQSGELRTLESGFFEIAKISHIYKCITYIYIQYIKNTGIVFFNSCLVLTYFCFFYMIKKLKLNKKGSARSSLCFKSTPAIRFTELLLPDLDCFFVQALGLSFIKIPSILSFTFLKYFPFPKSGIKTLFQKKIVCPYFVLDLRFESKFRFIPSTDLCVIQIKQVLCVPVFRCYFSQNTRRTTFLVLWWYYIILSVVL